MRFGCCAAPDKLTVLESAGYDYIEPTVSRTLMPEESEQELASIRRLFERSQLKAEAFNVFLPADLKVTGPDVDLKRAYAYVATAFRRVQELGGDTVVFGSGPARNVPDGFPFDKAHAQLREFCLLCSNLAAQRKITIVIEPLYRGGSNIIQTFAEGVALAKDCNRPQVQVLVDNYHASYENEPFDHWVKEKAFLKHVHISDPSRTWPGSTDYDFGPFMRSLRQAGYDRRISVECSWTDFDAEAPRALEVVKHEWAKSAE